MKRWLSLGLFGALSAAAGCATTSGAGRGAQAPQAERGEQPSSGDAVAKAAPRALPRSPSQPLDAPLRAPERAPSPEAYRALLAAEMRQLEGDLPGAVESVQEAVIHDPGSAFLRVRLGQLHLAVGDVERALEAAKAARGIDPFDLEALRLHASASTLAGDRDQAKELLRRALKMAPGDRPASTLLAELLIEEGRIDQAEQVIDELMRAEPGATDGYLVLARLFVERGERERALRYVERARERDIHSPEALALRVDLLHADGRFAEAVRPLKALVRERGDSRRTRHQLLVGLLLADEDDEAEALAAAWLDEDDSEDMLLLLADAYETAGAQARAAELILGAVPEGRPRSDRLGVRLGRLLLARRDYAGAERALCGLSHEGGDPGWVGYLRALCARARAQAGHRAEAAAELEAATEQLGANWRILAEQHRLAREPDSPLDDEAVLEAMAAAREEHPLDADLLDVQVRALEDHGRQGEASRLLDEALRQRPRQADLLMVKARYLERTGRARAAVTIVERLMERSDRPSADQLNFAAFTLADHGQRPADALRWAWQAVLRDPLNGYIVDTLGWAQKSAGQLDAAIATLQRADRLSPDEPEILLHLAEAFEAQGQADKALAYADRAAGLADPEDPIRPRIEEALARLRRSG